MLEPFQPGLVLQPIGPAGCGGPVPAAIGIKAQPIWGTQTVQQPFQDGPLQAIGRRGHLPLEGQGGAQAALSGQQLVDCGQGRLPRGQQPGRRGGRPPTTGSRPHPALQFGQGRAEGKAQRQRQGGQQPFQLMATADGA